MYGIEDLERATGYTTNQVRDRLAILSPILGEGVHRGRRGKVLVEDSILAALRRMAELEREGLSPKVARDQIVAELGNGHRNRAATFGERPATSNGEVQILRELLEEVRREREELRKDRDHWRELALRLQDRALALPAPRERRPWWSLPPFRWIWA